MDENTDDENHNNDFKSTHQDSYQQCLEKQIHRILQDHQHLWRRMQKMREAFSWRAQQLQLFGFAWPLEKGKERER
jgi:hypothetical protein